MESVLNFNNSGFILTLILIAIPAIFTCYLAVIKTRDILKNFGKKKELEEFEEQVAQLSQEEIRILEQRKSELDYVLSNNEHRGDLAPADTKGLIDNVKEVTELRFVEQKKRSLPRPNIDQNLTRLILWYLACATFWLIVGTTIGEYLGIKFVAPDADHFSWLSFGRLRPVHTNAVFWGWASLAMLGLGYYVIPRVSNT